MRPFLRDRPNPSGSQLGSQAEPSGSSLPGHRDDHAGIVARGYRRVVDCRPDSAGRQGVSTESVAVQPGRSFGTGRILRGSQLGSRRGISVACHRRSVMTNRVSLQSCPVEVACHLDSSGRQGLSTEPPESTPEARQSHRLEPWQGVQRVCPFGYSEDGEDTVCPPGKNVSDVHLCWPEVRSSPDGQTRG